MKCFNNKNEIDTYVYFDGNETFGALSTRNYHFYFI
jgi:hypothetical protein